MKLSRRSGATEGGGRVAATRPIRAYAKGPRGRREVRSRKGRSRRHASWTVGLTPTRHHPSARGSRLPSRRVQKGNAMNRLRSINLLEPLSRISFGAKGRNQGVFVAAHSVPSTCAQNEISNSLSE